MSLVSKRTMGFKITSLLKNKEPHAFHYLSERLTFWIAALSLFAFVTGNMVGQHGWHVFWKSVLGGNDDSLIAFTGTVPPIREVPDYAAWARHGGDYHQHSFRQVPRDLLRPLPTYDAADVSQAAFNTYFVDHLGTYKTGRGEGAHPGIDIAAPIGTPVQSIANGIVEKVASDPSGFGTYLVIRHPNAADPNAKGSTMTIHSIYAHLSETLVTEGTVVHKGDDIALTGQTGFATGPHLHFQVELASAPNHPFWPFTSKEAREAGLSFSQAVDAGLHRERGLLHLTHPMLYVQEYATYSAPVQTATQAAVKSSARSATTAITSKERVAARLAKRKEAALARQSALVAAHIVSVQTVAIETSALDAAAASSSSSVAATPVASPAVASILIRHDGSFARDAETITLTTIDADGNPVRDPTFSRPLHLRTGYGQAQFTPAVVSADDFSRGQGTVTVRMQPIGQTTIVIEVQPLGVLAKPMPFER